VGGGGVSGVEVDFSVLIEEALFFRLLLEMVGDEGLVKMEEEDIVGGKEFFQVIINLVVTLIIKTFSPLDE
jgi:hypothetical protein